MEELTRQNEELRQRVPPRVEDRDQQSNDEGDNRERENSDKTGLPSRMEEEFQNMKK